MLRRYVRGGAWDAQGVRSEWFVVLAVPCLLTLLRLFVWTDVPAY